MTVRRIALVTGAGSGIGRAAAKALAQAGLAVIVTDLDPGAAEAVRREIEAAGGTAMALRCDTADEASVAAAFATAEGRHGRLDVLVTAAGIDLHQGLDETTPAAWNRVLGINLTGSFLCIRAARAMMVAQGCGRIVCISSTSGVIGMGYPAYSASKAGLMGLVRAAARELSPLGITVNAVAPGPTETPLTDALWGADPARRQRIEAAVAVGRVATAEEIAAAILFLAAESSGFITGTELMVDGGITSVLRLAATPPALQPTPQQGEGGTRAAGG